MSRRARILLFIAVALLAAVGAALLFFFDPTRHTFYPRCPFFVLTGLKCPGCGTTRALHSLLHLDFAAAWRFNPFIYFAIVAAAATIASRRVRESRLFVQLLFWTTLAYWLLRNIFRF